MSTGLRKGIRKETISMSKEMIGIILCIYISGMCGTIGGLAISNWVQGKIGRTIEVFLWPLIFLAVIADILTEIVNWIARRIYVS